MPGNDTAIPLMPLDGRSHSHQLQNDRIRRISPDMPRGRSYPYPSNEVSNAKYNAITFVPVILFEQFKFFFNLYFLLVALSQIWPVLRIGYLSSYIVPLAFVLSVTMGKEAWDDWLRRKRDAEANAERYELASGLRVRARDLRVGDVVRLHTNQRVPADIVLLRSSEASGEAFIRTDQLDGETDWKLRSACAATQSLGGGPVGAEWDFEVMAPPPEKSIHVFTGSLRSPQDGESYPLTIDNTMWANTVVAAATVEGVVVYTGKDTRMAMNTSPSRNKVGLLEIEVNGVSKILCASVFVLSFVLVALQGFGPRWYVQVMRFLILFSTIIPVSLRVNLDMAKTVYARQIENDPTIPSTIVRTSTIPEDLGRIDYLLTDKTGTITQNDMDLRKIHIGTMAFYGDSMDDVRKLLEHAQTVQGGVGKRHRDLSARVSALTQALAVCHSVTPTVDGFQAVSPDEIAIVRWVASVGLELIQRDRRRMTLRTSDGIIHDYEILYVFPFNSDSKRMGIIVRYNGEIWFFLKGADVAMGPLVKHNDWLDEEVGNMAREGLRTLVVARRRLSTEQLADFEAAYSQASLVMSAQRDVQMAAVVSEHLEHDLELLGVTGVEDKLQADVRPSLELLRNAGVHIWMLTGDKVETAHCVAVSSRLVSRGQSVYTVTGLQSLQQAHQHLDFLAQTALDSALLMDGQSLQFFMTNLPLDFGNLALQLPVVVACRCTPQQKADLTRMVKQLTGRRVCAIGDGGNDVSMIQAADVGVGIVGKEGRQASLAADFSVTQFCHLTRLLLWHGRNSYKRSAKLAQVVIHRGLVISVCQAVYSVSSHFEPLALYQGWLMVGYATIYTMCPVFSLVTDRDVDAHLARLYPELYKELKDGRSLSYRSFFMWTLTALYQGTLIQGLAQLLTSLRPERFTEMVFVSFSALVLVVLVVVAVEIVTWNRIMLACELLTLATYIATVPFLGDYFDLSLPAHGWFWAKVAAIIAAAVVPPVVAKVLGRHLKPPSYAKVQV